MQFRIEKADNNAAKLIDRELMLSLRKHLAQANNEQIVLTAKTDNDQLIAGLTASTSYGWLLIKTLWVDESQRRNGIGTSLLDYVEGSGRKCGCHGAWLDTSSPDARTFYSAQGYSTFAELANSTGQQPESHRRWFMSKRL